MKILTAGALGLAGGLFLAALQGAPPASGNEWSALERQFVNPPDDCRIMMRWWWFGPAVQKPEIERELRVMKSAGIGGVEIQPVYPLELDDPQTGFHNEGYLSEEFLASLRFASDTARQLGMRVDITLGSGWPYGGPHVPVSEASARLRIERRPLSHETASVSVPSMENGEGLLAEFLLDAKQQPIQTKDFGRLAIREGRVILPPESENAGSILFFLASRTGQQVKRASVGAEGFVLNHYSAPAVDRHLKTVGDRLLSAFAVPPYAVFSDSLEVYGADWADDLLAEFARRRGYDLLPHLPALAADTGERASEIRHDWGQTLTELAEERFLEPIAAWARSHHTRFRSQTYGEPPVILSSAARVDLPEGEAGPHWRTFNTARWASSASHLYGRRVTSSETWTWLHAPSFRATPLDMKAEADLHFIEGINQLIGHGWPYSPPEAGEPGWRFYASAAFNDHNPWFQVMPDIARYLQRVSFLMRQGRSANDIAIYLPTHDAWAAFRPGKTSVDHEMESLLGGNLITQILDRGYGFDYIDDEAIAKSGVPYHLLVLPNVERMPLKTLEAIEAYAQKQGLVIADRRLPSQAPGFLQSQTDSARVATLAGRLFSGGNARARVVRDEQLLGKTLREMLTPDVAVDSEAASQLGFTHRKLNQGDVYFVVNTSNRPLETSAEIRVSGLVAESWDPFSGERTEVDGRDNGRVTAIDLRLAPYESRVVIFRRGATAAKTAISADGRETVQDLGSDWKVTFEGMHKTTLLPRLQSWTENEDTRFYSGRVAYEKQIDLPQDLTAHGARATLDFGPGSPVIATGTGAPGMRALLESPVRESALVYVNGQLAGSVWHPPYQVDISQFVRPGANSLRILVANLAINEMAGRALPDYRLLNLRYGTRFSPQGFENLQPLPAGILGPVRIILK